MAETQGEAGVWARQSWIVIVAESVLQGWDDDGICRGRAVADFDAYCHRFPADSPEEDIGAGLRAALIKSQVGMSCEWEAEQLKISFERKLATAFGTRDVRRLYSGMSLCSATRVREIITFQPLRRKRGGTFLAMEDDVGLHETTHRFDAEDADIGRALLECLSRCR
jgi:hypothetical protein